MPNIFLLLFERQLTGSQSYLLSSVSCLWLFTFSPIRMHYIGSPAQRLVMNEPKPRVDATRIESLLTQNQKKTLSEFR